MATETLRLEHLGPRLGAMASRVESLTFAPALKVASVMIGAAAKENFARGHAPDGTPWAPLKRPRSGSKGGDRPLRDTGLLMASVSGGSGHVEEVSAFALLAGTRVGYGQYHQHGTRTVPARPFLGFGPALVEKLDRVFSDHLGREMSRA